MRISNDLTERGVAMAVLLFLAGCGGSAESREGAGEALEDEVAVVESSEEAAVDGVTESSAPSSAQAAARPSGSSSAARPSGAASSVATPAGSAMVAVPAGTSIPAVMEVAVSTRTHRTGDIFHARITEEILASDGMVLIPLGSRLEGRVAEAKQSESANEEALLLLTFEHLLIRGERIPIRTVVAEAQVESSADASGARTAATVATGAAAGAVVGRILGRDSRSTVAGAVVGAVAGTGVALSTRDGHASIGEGARVVVRLETPAVLSDR